MTRRIAGPLRRVAWLVSAVAATLIGGDLSAPRSATAAAQPASPTETSVEAVAISPYWGPNIQRWGDYIGVLSEVYGFHPDFIAAVIKHESDGEYQAISHIGAVGAMGVMPAGSGLEWRPSSEVLLMPSTNLRWGMAILSYVVQQSGGDLYTALAAYNGGWNHVNGRLPQEYAARVLDSYGRALIARAGMSPEMANRWTVAVEIRAGNVPAEAVLVLGNKPISGLRTFAEHIVYAFADESGHTFHVRGYAVPIGLTEIIFDDGAGANPDELEAPLRARLGDKSARGAPGNPRILLACLPSLVRLRGQVTTRWYSPSSCPDVER